MKSTKVSSRSKAKKAGRNKSRKGGQKSNYLPTLSTMTGGKELSYTSLLGGQMVPASNNSQMIKANMTGGQVLNHIAGVNDYNYGYNNINSSNTMKSLISMGNIISQMKQNTSEGLSNAVTLANLASSNVLFTQQQLVLSSNLSNSMIGNATGISTNPWGSNNATNTNLWASMLAVNDATTGYTTSFPLGNALTLTMTPVPAPAVYGANGGGSQKGGQAVPAPVPANSVNSLLNANSLVASLQSFAATAQALYSATLSGVSATQQHLSNTVTDFNAASAMDQAAFSLSNAFFGCPSGCLQYTPGSAIAPVVTNGVITTAGQYTMPTFPIGGPTLVGLSNTILVNTKYAPYPAPAVGSPSAAWLPPLIV